MSEQQNRKRSIQEKTYVLVILIDAYGGTENYPVFYANEMYLTTTEKSYLHRSTPNQRKFRKIPGCHGDYDFGENNNEEKEPDTFWTALRKDEDISEFTAANKCQVYLAYANE